MNQTFEYTLEGDGEDLTIHYRIIMGHPAVLYPNDKAHPEEPEQIDVFNVTEHIWSMSKGWHDETIDDEKIYDWACDWAESHQQKLLDHADEWRDTPCAPI